jgi:hypothetical protein
LIPKYGRPSRQRAQKKKKKNKNDNNDKNTFMTDYHFQPDPNLNCTNMLTRRLLSIMAMINMQDVCQTFFQGKRPKAAEILDKTCMKP